MAIQVAIDGYDSLEQIGVGGMAAVYKARKVSIDKTVAIKVLFPYLATDATFTERFQREARAAASIQHDNIVNVIDFGESEGSFYIVMEYYDGRTLEDLMKSRTGLPLDVSAQIILEVACGLEAAHALDIVHRDIKPANIIYTTQGGIKIADFGLAKKSDSVTMITQMGKVMGTPAYMSPEQAAGRAVGPASDVFSLGVVAYELLGRRKPFEGNSYSEVLEKIQMLEPPSVADINPLIDAGLERIVARMLAKDDRDRYPGATELIADLEAAMEKMHIARDRRRLAAYIRDPDAYDAQLREKVVSRSLSRGAFFMQKGEGHLDDALLEFRRILFVDPDNERARRNLERIKLERGDDDRTVEVDVVTGEARARAPRKTARRHRRPPRWLLAAAAGAAALVIAGTTWLAHRGGEGAWPDARRVPTAQSDRLDTPVGPLVAEAHPLIPADSTARDAAPIQAASQAEPPSVTTAPAKSPARPPATKAPAVSRPAAGAGTPGHAGEPAPVPTGSVAAAGADSQATTRRTVTRTGTLSVYFLGGVGEFFVDGKHFSHQPPFDAVSMPAGTYHVACRMSGDPAPRKLVIRIVADHNTVIEYELGGEPVVRTGP